MNPGSEILLGFFLLGIGVILWISIRLVVKELNPQKKNLFDPSFLNFQNSVNSNAAAMFVIEAGGKLNSINEKAIELFGLEKNASHSLESLASKVNPIQTFYDLCVESGEKEFSVNNKLVKAINYSIEMHSLIFLKQIESETSETINLSDSQMKQSVSDFSKSIFGSLDLDKTVYSILENISRIVPADLIELNILDEDGSNLIPFQLGKISKDETSISVLDKHTLGNDYTGLIIKDNQSIWLEDLENDPNYVVGPFLEKQLFHTLMGFPLVIGHEVLGTIEFYKKEKSGFLKPQFALIENICPHIATSINNAILFRDKNQKALELSTLAQLAQSVSYSKEPEKIFEKMLATITPMIPVEIMGFLLFNNSTNMLEAQNPFIGLPKPFIDIFKTEIKKDSNAEKLIVSQDVLITENAQVDLHWIILGLDHIARAASIRETVLIPLISGGVSYGFMMASNHSKKTKTFSPSEMHLLMIIANQAAPIIENMILVMQSTQKAQSAEALRRIAVFSSSNASLESILSFSIEELVKLFKADIGAILLLNKDSSRLELNQNSIFGEVIKENQFLDSLLTADQQYQFTITATQNPVVLGEFDKTEPIIPFYQNYFDQLTLQSIIIVPLLVKDEGIGEIWIGSKKPYNFDAGDVQILLPAAIQMANVIEHQHLALTTDDSLRKTVEKLSSINKANRDLSSTIDLEELINLIILEGKKISGASGASFLVFDDLSEGNQPINFLMTAGEPRNSELSQIEIDLLLNKKNQLFIGDEDLRPLHFSPEIKSVMFFSFPYNQKVSGALYLLSEDESIFSRTIFDQVQLYISQTFNAFENSLNYFKQQQSIFALNQKIEIQQRIFSLNLLDLNKNSVIPFSEKIIGEIKSFFPITGQIFYYFDPESNNYLKIFSDGNGFLRSINSNNKEISWEQFEIIKNPDNLVNGFYVLPFSKMENIFDQIDSEEFGDPEIVVYPFSPESATSKGFAFLDIKNFNDFSKGSLEILEFLLSQLFNLYETRQVLEYKTNHELIQSSVDQDGALPSKDLKIENSFHEQIISGIDEIIHDLLNENDLHRSLNLIAETLLSTFVFDSAIIFQKDPSSGSKVYEYFNIELDQILIESLLGQRNPIDFVQKTELIFLVSDVKKQSDWANSPLVIELKTQSFMVIPVPLSTCHFFLYLFSDQIKNELSAVDIKKLTKRVQLFGLILQKQQLRNIDEEEIKKITDQMHYIDSVNSLDQGQIMDQLLQKLIEKIPAAQTGWIAIWDDADPRIKPIISKGYKNSNAMLEVNFSTSNWSLPQIVFENNNPLSVNDLNFPSNYLLEGKDLISYQQATGGNLPVGNLLAPIAFEDNLAGILVLENFNKKSRFEKSDEIATVSLIENTIPFFKNAIKFQETQKKAILLTRKEDQSFLLKKTNASIFSTTNINASIRNALNHLLVGFEAELGIIYLKNKELLIETEQNQTINPQKNYQDNKEKIKEAFEKGILNPNISIINETYSDEYWSKKIGKDFPFGSLLFTPLIWSGEQLGAILFGHKDPFFFNDFHKEILDSILPQLNFVINNLEISQTLFNQSDKLMKLTLENESLESQSKAVLDSFPDAIVITDFLGKIKHCNRSVEKILGENFSDFENRTIMEIPIQSNSDFESWKNIIISWTKNPVLLNIDQNFSSKIHLSSDRLLSLFSSPIIWKSGFLGTVTIFRDITLESQIDRIKSEFISNVSHELRTPLTSIKGYADILLMGAAGDIQEEQKRFIDIIHNNAIRLTTLVDNLLDISKIETDKVDLYNRAIYLDEIISQIIKEFDSKSITDNKELKFDIRIPKNINPVRGDENRLGQIIRILLNNSYHYSHSPVNITIRVSQTGSETQIDIQDNGIGIKKEFQSHIFDRFFRGEEELVLSTAGTGLGLAVAKSLVEMLGGQIWFYSSGIDGEGSVFSFTVPGFIEG